MITVTQRRAGTDMANYLLIVSENQIKNVIPTRRKINKLA